MRFIKELKPILNKQCDSIRSSYLFWSVLISLILTSLFYFFFQFINILSLIIDIFYRISLFIAFLPFILVLIALVNDLGEVETSWLFIANFYFKIVFFSFPNSSVRNTWRHERRIYNWYWRLKKDWHLTAKMTVFSDILTWICATGRSM